MNRHEYIPDFSTPLVYEDYVLLVVLIRQAHYHGHMSTQEANQILETFVVEPAQE